MLMCFSKKSSIYKKQMNLQQKTKIICIPANHHTKTPAITMNRATTILLTHTRMIKINGTQIISSNTETR